MTRDLKRKKVVELDEGAAMKGMLGIHPGNRKMEESTMEKHGGLENCKSVALGSVFVSTIITCYAC